MSSPVVLDSVLETSNAPGTGAFVLDGCPEGAWRTFKSALPDGGAVYYVATDGLETEWGIGTLKTAEVPTLERSRLIGNIYNSKNWLNFTGKTKIYSFLPGDKVVCYDDSNNIPVLGDIILSGHNIFSGDTTRCSFQSDGNIVIYHNNDKLFSVGAVNNIKEGRFCVSLFAPNPEAGEHSDRVATTEFVGNAVAAISDELHAHQNKAVVSEPLSSFDTQVHSIRITHNNPHPRIAVVGTDAKYNMEVPNSTDLSDEINRAKTAERDLDNRLASEINRAKTAETDMVRSWSNENDQFIDRIAYNKKNRMAVRVAEADQWHFYYDTEQSVEAIVTSEADAKPETIRISKTGWGGRPELIIQNQGFADFRAVSTEAVQDVVDKHNALQNKAVVSEPLSSFDTQVHSIRITHNNPHPRIAVVGTDARYNLEVPNYNDIIKSRQFFKIQAAHGDYITFPEAFSDDQILVFLNAVSVWGDDYDGHGGNNFLHPTLTTRADGTPYLDATGFRLNLFHYWTEKDGHGQIWPEAAWIHIWAIKI